ncbi:MAG: hypothetical protein ACO29V_02835 [Limnohabitans sp.]
MTRRESILAAIRAALTGTVHVGTRIYRSRVEPLSRGESPAIVVEPMNDLAEERNVPYLDWTLQVAVTVITRGLVPDQLADPIIESAHSKLLADVSLGGLAFDIIPASVQFELVEGDQPVGVTTMVYRVRYRTRLTDLTTA